MDCPSRKTIWSYWQQGVDVAPQLVQACWSSWRRRNPDYEVICLDSNTLSEYTDCADEFDMTRRDIPVEKFSNIVRLSLLRKYGGVWADATVYCSAPLESWLADYYTSKFFAFRQPGPDRMFSSWFIAAESDNLILERFYEEWFQFYKSNHFVFQNTRLGRYLVNRLSPRGATYEQTLFWHSWLVRKVLRIYPYHIFHYTFNKVILGDPTCRDLWKSSKPYLAETPHELQRLRLCKDASAEKAKLFIDSNVAPVHKLNWRWDDTKPYWREVLPYLFRQDKP
jgi:hypothetical protein